MDQHNQLLLAQAEELECPCIKHLLNHLQLRKVVATTKRSQGLVEFRGFKFRCSENFLHVALPRMFQVEAQIGPAVELDVTLDQVGFEQRHTAADVAADEVRVDEPLGYEGRTHRAAFARVQIRKTDCQAHPIEVRRSIELANRLAFDPALGRGEKAHIEFQSVWSCFLSSPAKRDWGFSGRVASEFRIPHSACKWSPRLVSRQRLLLFREALICLSYSGKWSSRAVTLRVLPLIRRVLCS